MIFRKDRCFLLFRYFKFPSGWCFLCLNNSYTIFMTKSQLKQKISKTPNIQALRSCRWCPICPDPVWTRNEVCGGCIYTSPCWHSVLFTVIIWGGWSQRLREQAAHEQGKRETLKFDRAFLQYVWIFHNYFCFCTWCGFNAPMKIENVIS